MADACERPSNKDQVNSILHVVPGLGERWSGIAVAAKLLAKEQSAELVDARSVDARTVARFDEVWVHSTWSWPVWRACRLTKAAGKKLVRMTHGNLDPVRLVYHGFKKRLAGPVERYFLRRSDVVIATCETEADWILAYEPRVKSIEVVDLKRFFNLNANQPPIHLPPSPNILYLGRRHQLKGINFLVEVLAQLHGVVSYKFRAVSNAFGKEKDEVWNWCDVLILPTLSENFGLVVAEALERGKRVITTDGAPAWSPSAHATGDKGDGNNYGGRLVYIKGYRDGSDENRVRLLKEAITSLIG